MEKHKLSGGVIGEEVEARLMRSHNVNCSGTVIMFSVEARFMKSHSQQKWGLMKNHIVGGSEIDEKFIVSGSGTDAK